MTRRLCGSGWWGKKAVDEGDDVVHDVVFVVEAGKVGGVGWYQPRGGGGHDDDHGDASHVAFDGGAAHPAGVVVGEAVEEG